MKIIVRIINFILLSHFSLATDVTDATLGASGLWLGTRTGAGDTVTLTKSFFGRSPWLHGQQDLGFCAKNNELYYGITSNHCFQNIKKIGWDQ